VIAAALELLQERGASRLTTREVATRAGVSEGSVFYHFTDRTGLLTAVIEDGLAAFKTVGAGGIGGDNVHTALDRMTSSLETYLGRALLVMIAAQSDAELRQGLADYLIGNDLGPHRGVQALGAYLRREQAKGSIRDDVDAEAVAFLVVSSCFTRVSQQQMIGPDYGRDLPDRSTLVNTVTALLMPVTVGPQPNPGSPAPDG
jgi:AcrR family transcriptional regulator